MATRSNPKKQRRGKRPQTRRNKRPPRQTEPMSHAEREDLELAEEILRQDRKDQPILAAGFKKLLKQLGIKGKPIGAKKLKERMLAEGFDPESNEFSRGIIEMREEQAWPIRFTWAQARWPSGTSPKRATNWWTRFSIRFPRAESIS